MIRRQILLYLLKTLEVISFSSIIQNCFELRVDLKEVLTPFTYKAEWQF